MFPALSINCCEYSINLPILTLQIQMALIRIPVWSCFKNGFWTSPLWTYCIKLYTSLPLYISLCLFRSLSLYHTFTPYSRKQEGSNRHYGCRPHSRNSLNRWINLKLHLSAFNLQQQQQQQQETAFRLSYLTQFKSKQKQLNHFNSIFSRHFFHYSQIKNSLIENDPF